jgi:ABC-type bacteriocin/lantibiotic exporter with double-glycine peptidase domain
LILKFSKGKLNAWSKNREEYDNNLSKAVLESLGGIKDFKIYNAENFFIKKYSELNLQKAGLISKYLTLSQTPRFLLEITLVVGILIFIIFMFFNNTDSIDIVSSLGLFVAASFRLIPSVNKLIFSLQSIGYNKISINLLKKEFKINSKQNQSAESNIKFNNKIVIKDLSYRYPSQKRLQLEKLNFEILKGQKVGIIGESGSGKSTFVDLFTALLEPTDGDILVDGQSIYHSEKSWKSKMGYVPQSIYLMDDTIANNITLFEKSRQIDYELLEKVIKNVGLYDYINSLPKGVSTTVGEKGVNLSGGQLQRIGLARAFYRQPQVLILDESTSALDPVTEKVILESIYKMSNTLTVIFISHKKSNLDKCDVIYKIEENLLSIV